MSCHNKPIQVYGFGSFFDGSLSYGDIDLLIVHENLSAVSCRSAIMCKSEIINLYPCAHITILSVQEEESISFIAKSKATALGSICLETLDVDIEIIACAINSANAKRVKISGVQRIPVQQIPEWDIPTGHRRDL
ncbi:hypothetical protein [Dechloromonas hortensis]|uniref:hypothetical protein n=1 Tax=Dechloromonas hortensis TaxID=337779 RepID=UPI001290D4EB|nr:hypothetical protein [Dechloromonas hortensis]